MKITGQDEYGLRVLNCIARCQVPEGMSIPQLSEAEGLSVHYVAKLTRLLRIAGLINSTRGHIGGYVLAKPANKITVNQALNALGGKLFDANFCNEHTGILKVCTSTGNCSTRSLWKMVQFTIDQLLNKVTLQDLIGSEKETKCTIQEILEMNANKLIN